MGATHVTVFTPGAESAPTCGRELVRTEEHGETQSDSTPGEDVVSDSRFGSIRVAFQDSVSAHDSLVMKLKDPALPSKKKERVVHRSGRERSQGSNRTVDKERIIDRRNDWYMERVIDCETGEIIHDCDEPLSDHQGHGSARR